MPNRAQRRKQARDEKHNSRDACRLAAPEQYRLGFTDGAKEAVKACYAAICLAAHGPHHEFMHCNEDIIVFLREVDEHIVMCLESDEVIDKAFNETGLLLDFSKTFSDERIQEQEAS